MVSSTESKTDAKRHPGEQPYTRTRPPRYSRGWGRCRRSAPAARRVFAVGVPFAYPAVSSVQDRFTSLSTRDLLRGFPGFRLRRVR
jgi:hypothetical protein